MLLLDARGRKLIVGVCSRSGDILYKNSSDIREGSLISNITSSLSHYDHSFRPFQIAMTMAPGNPESINQCIKYCKTFNCPIRPLHHIDAHMCFMKKPYLGLIANSSNTEILLFDGKNYKILGMSIDISLGTAYYLLSKTINIPLSKFSNLPETEILNYPQPVINHKGLDFSFQGTYYFTLQHIFPKLKELKRAQLHDPCYLQTNQSGMNVLANSFQKSIIQQITNKINKAMAWTSQHYPHIKNFAFSGGVAKNEKIKLEINKLCEEKGWKMKCGHESDNVEMLRNCVFSSKGEIFQGENLAGLHNYPIGEYIFISD